MKYLSRLLVIASVACGFAACSDTAEIIDLNSPQQGDMTVNVSFSLADKAMQTRSKVSGTEVPVHVMQMVCFDANGQYLGIRNAEVSSSGPGTNPPMFDTGVIQGTVPQGTSRIHFIANRDLTIPLSFSNGTSEETVMKSLELSTAYNDADHQEVCYWGYHKEANDDAMNTWLNPAEGTNNIVYMIRDRAKVILTYDPTGANENVEVTKVEWLIHNGRERGYLAPKSSDWDSYYGNSTQTGHTAELIATAGLNEYTTCNRYSLYDEAAGINDEGNFDVAYEKGTTTNLPQFLFDDNNEDIDNVKVILRVTYNLTEDGTTTTTTVYHTLRLNDDDKVKYDIIRNNTYYIKCKMLSPNVDYYHTLKEAIDGEEFVNADVEIDRSITDINDEDYTLQILLPSETTATVLNTAGTHELHFAFRLVSDITTSGTEDTDEFNIYWENSQSFCSEPTLTYDGDTKQFVISTDVIEDQLTDYLQDEWIVVEHKESGLKRYIHVFVINQFRYRLDPTLTKVGNDYLLSFQIPPAEHEQFITDEGGNTIPDPNEHIYPSELYPIDVKFATNTLNAYGTTQGTNSYGLFGVSIEGTSPLTVSANFESGFNSPVSTTATTDITHWYYQQAFNYWDFWYTYSLKTYPTDGVVNIYFKDVRDNIQYATVEDVGLFLYVQYFGKNYSVPVTQ